MVTEVAVWSAFGPKLEGVTEAKVAVERNGVC
jgi:hypothetical protein